MEISKKPLYNLSLVLGKTGVKADTLRAWERRYQLPQPKRTEGGHRLFSDYDIATIKWLLDQQSDGMRIGQAAGLWREIESQGKDPLTYKNTKNDYSFGQMDNLNEKSSLSELQLDWIEACLTYNEELADQVLTRAFAQFPMEIVISDLIHPGLNEVGRLWYEGKITVHQEHYVSELAVKKLGALISSAPNPILDITIIVGCPPGEQHMISALMLNLLLKFQGYEVVYLGSNNPQTRFVETVEEVTPDLVILTASRLPTAAKLVEIVELLEDNQVPVAFGGWIFNQIENLTELIPAHYLGKSLSEAIPEINRLLADPVPRSEKKGRNSLLDETKDAFLSQRSEIDLKVITKVKQSNDKILLPNQLKEFTDFLSQDIEAALMLGNLDILDFDLNWIKASITENYLRKKLRNTCGSIKKYAESFLDLQPNLS
jgi:methanogenic corrinoid protein MtbC1